jgi:predicted dehydrogenase
MNKIKLGVIGGGINSAVGYAHFSAVNLDSKFVYHKGFFSREHKINIESAEKYKIKRENLFSNLDELINSDSDIDSWLILTPTPTHFEILKKLKLTSKPVICEKALCSNLNEAEEISKIYNSQDLFVIFNYTGYPMVREAREIIKSGVLGELVTINMEMPQSGFIKRNSIGKIPMPQDWRLQDDEIATISLDLGVHLHSLLCFICDLQPKEIFANANSFGLNKTIIDNILVSMSFEGGAIGSFWFSKTALGNLNGLKFRIFGTKGSIEWIQETPDFLKYSNENGVISIINLANNHLITANKPSYNRFKAGHPTGFIEALANYYLSIYNKLTELKGGNYLLTLNEVQQGMILMHLIQQSIEQKANKNL